MGLPWGKILGATKKGLSFAGLVWPPAKAIERAMDAAELIRTPGVSKLEKVKAASSSVLDFSGLTEAQQAMAETLRDTAIEAGLQAREATAASVLAWQALQEFMESVKPAEVGTKG